MWWHYLITLVAVWNLAPIVAVWFLHVPAKHKVSATRCFIEVALKGFIDIIPNLTAPVVMLLVLPFVKREANALPRLFWWWDNNVSINGDGWAVLRGDKWVKVEGDELPGEVAIAYGDPRYTGDAYYCKGHRPRSFLARYVWLGLRNRGAKLSEELGVSLSPRDNDRELWGTDPIGQGVEGWALYRAGDAYQFHWIKKAGPLELRASTGYKVWARNQWGVERASVTNITISARRWKWQS